MVFPCTHAHPAGRSISDSFNSLLYVTGSGAGIVTEGLALTTITVQDTVVCPLLHVIVAVPGETAVTLPSPETFATDSSLLAKFTALTSSINEPLTYGIKTCVWFTAKLSILVLLSVRVSVVFGLEHAAAGMFLYTGILNTNV